MFSITDLGIRKTSRTTIAGANERRSDEMFAEIAAWLMGQADRSVKRDGEHLLYLVDSTSITLKGQQVDNWTAQNRTRNTQGIKLHLLLDTINDAPAGSSFSAANVNDVELARSVPITFGHPVARSRTFIFPARERRPAAVRGQAGLSGCGLGDTKYRPRLQVDGGEPSSVLVGG